MKMFGGGQLPAVPDLAVGSLIRRYRSSGLAIGYAMSTSSFFTSFRKSLTWPKIAGTVFRGWEVREKILRPVIVNLLTASLIFLAAVIFKDRIYNYFAPQPQAKDWPIYCVLEPEPSTGGPVTADLFVLNLTPRKYVRNDLDTLANDLSPGDGTKISALIEVSMKDGLVDEKIPDIQPDVEFNKEKGSAVAEPVDQARTHWRIRLDEIKEGKILKFIVHTSSERPISSRASFATLPVKVTYARAP
jgi:hypothetical protein